ncbi:MAG: CRTAC1 family protein [Chloroflexota bacterium]
MCFSLRGRIQTRLIALLWPAVLTLILVFATGEQRFFSMFLVMLVVGLDLEAFVYPRLFGYQAHWHTYLLGIGEFFLYLLIVRWLGGTLPLASIIWFYAAAWLGGQLIMNVLVPIVDPMWVEHGGELWRQGSGRLGRSRFLLHPSSHGLVAALLVFFLIVQLTLLPVTLQPLQALAAPLAALAMAALWSAARGKLGETDWLEAACYGLLLALLIRGPGIWQFAAAGAIAVLFRSVLRVGRRPFFNAAAAAFVVAVLFLPGVYSGQSQWGNSLLLPLVIANLAILLGKRDGAWPAMLGFGAVLAVPALAAGALSEDPSLPTYLIFFGGFLLADRATLPKNRWLQLVTGAIVAGLGLELQSVGLGLPFAIALLATNYASRLIELGSRVWALRGRRQPAKEKERTTITAAADVGRLTSRRAFLGTVGAAAGGVVLAGTTRRLSGLDPAILSLPPETALAGGRAIPLFRNVAGSSGIALAHHGNHAEGSPAVGTGAAWGDFDGDGRLDLYVTDHMADSHLYRNNGNGTFTDVAHSAGVAHPTIQTTSASFVDYDNDGWPDLYVGAAHGPNVLYHNDRDGTFTDVTKKSGLGDTERTMSTVWADYDGDGYLDVFVANYSTLPITLNPHSTPMENFRTVLHLPRPNNHLFHNNGDGTFTDVSDLLGFQSTQGFGFSAVWFDYNHDGRPDLYVAYDFGWVVQPNTLWRNDGPAGHGWQFSQVQKELGVNASINAMSAASGDYNNDGWADLAVSNIGPNLLYRNGDGRRFHNQAEVAKVAHAVDKVTNMLNPSMTWGTDFADFNNDGWLDLYIVAGAMFYENVPQPNELYLNNGDGGFTDVSAASGTNDPGQGRSVAVADFNNDGNLDMFVANYAQPPLLYRNIGGNNGNHWLRLQLEGTESNRDAVGTRVTVHAARMRPQVREVQIGQGLGSCDDKALHFGLGKAESVRVIDIEWPSGKGQRLEHVPVNRVIKVREPGPSRWA